MNYTKGEWKAEQDAANSIRIFSQDSEQIASVMDYDGNDITEEMEANAHLIAAAPEMYEALEHISVILANPLTTRKEATPELRAARARDEAWIISREALAKAEGK